MGKWCLHASSFIFDPVIIKVASNQDRHKSSDLSTELIKNKSANFFLGFEKTQILTGIMTGIISFMNIQLFIFYFIF